MLTKYLPAPVRKVIYSALLTAQALEIIWDLIPEGLEGKLLNTATALGFALAVSKTADEKPYERDLRAEAYD